MCIGQYFYDKILPVCITISVTALLFMVDKVIGYRLKKIEIRRSWYLDIIIKPNTNIIDGFFNDTVSLFIEFNIYVVSIQNTTIGSHISKKNELLSKFRDLKTNINNNLIILLRDRHKDMYHEINSLLMEIEDYISNTIDKMETNDDFQNFISNKKREFLALLYKFID